MSSPTGTPATPTPERSERQQRNRLPRACRACRKRKVRCNYGQPCRTCVKREHEHLCIYDKRPVRLESISPVDESRAKKTQSHFDSELNLSRELPILRDVPPQPDQDNTIPSPLSQPDCGLITLLDSIAENAVAGSELDNTTGQTVFVGCRSRATIFRAMLPHLPSSVPSRSTSIHTAFGLTNQTRSHPFASLWNTTARISLGDILQSLPSPETCLLYYHCYQQMVHPFFPVLHDLEAFERHLCSVLDQISAKTEERSHFSTRLAADTPRPEMAAYSLLFAVLASGCQVCPDQLPLTVRVFVACSWECLRLANFYVSPSLDTVQATLIVEQVLCNESNPGVAMNVLGITARQAQNLGLHTRTTHQSSELLSLNDLQPTWRAVMFLDSPLALAFDRMPASFLPEQVDILQPLVDSTALSFWDCMFVLHCLQIRWQTAVSRDALKSASPELVRKYLELTTQLGRFARSSKSAIHRPASIQATLEQLVFTIHLENFEAVLSCYAALSSRFSEGSRVQYFLEMTSNHESVIESYLKLRRLLPLARVPGEIIYAALSSAILLAAFECVLGKSSSTPVLEQVCGTLKEAPIMDQDPSNDDNTWVPWRAGSQVLEALLQCRSHLKER